MSPGARRSPGRRPGGPDTRGEIVRAARESFAQHGFAATSLRAVARAAGVDAALVHHYFDGKRELFIEAMALPIDPWSIRDRILSGPREDIGRRIVTIFLDVWESPDGRPRMEAVLRSIVGSEEVARMIREVIGRTIIGPVARTLEVPDGQLRVALVAGQLTGLAVTRYIVCLDPIATLSVEDIIARVGPIIQHYLTA